MTLLAAPPLKNGAIFDKFFASARVIFVVRIVSVGSSCGDWRRPRSLSTFLLNVMSKINPTPDDIVSCEFWFRSALLMHQSCEQRLCKALNVEREGLQQALLTTRARGMDVHVSHALAAYCEAEAQLDKADRLYELAKSVAECNANHQKLEC